MISSDFGSFGALYSEEGVTRERYVFSNVAASLCRFLHLGSCHLLCHLYHCTINLPSALSPALRPPLHPLSHAHPPQHLMGSTSLHCLPQRTRGHYPVTVREGNTNNETNLCLLLGMDIIDVLLYLSLSLCRSNLWQESSVCRISSDSVTAIYP